MILDTGGNVYISIDMSVSVEENITREHSIITFYSDISGVATIVEDSLRFKSQILI